jgi:GAF domain-containing protein/putative methionine-R-sulfoxide reductase with GAF domain
MPISFSGIGSGDSTSGRRKSITSAFISYAHEDLAWATSYADLLRRLGIEPFLDVASIRDGDRWRDVIRRRIQSADCTILGWSEYAKDSVWVEKEWRETLAHRHDLLFKPLDDTPLPRELQAAQPERGNSVAEALITFRRRDKPYSEIDQQLLCCALEMVLVRPIDAVRIEQEPGGEVHLVVPLDADSAGLLDDLSRQQDPALVAFLAKLDVVGLQVRKQLARRISNSSLPVITLGSNPTDCEFFIVFAEGDSAAYALELSETLRNAGHRVFPEGKPGQPFETPSGRLVSALQTAKIIVVVVPSDEAAITPPFRAEVGRAVAIHGNEPDERIIIPILLQSRKRIREGSLPEGVRDFQAIDATEVPKEVVVRRLSDVALQLKQAVVSEGIVDRETIAPSNAAVVAVEITLSLSVEDLTSQGSIAALGRLLGVNPERFSLREAGRNTAVASIDLEASEFSRFKRMLPNPATRTGGDLLSEQSICHVRFFSRDESWRALYDVSASKRRQLPSVTLVSEAISQLYDPTILDVTNPWSVADLRAKMDGSPDEQAVIGLVLHELHCLPDVTAVALSIVRRREERVVRYLQSADDRATTQAWCEEWVDRCLKDRVDSQCVRGNEYHHFVPLIDLDVIVGVAHIVLSRAQSATPLFCAKLAGVVANEIHRARRLEAYDRISRSMADALIVQQQLDTMLEEIVAIGFDYAAVSIPDRFTGDIEIVQAKNVPSSWIRQARHPLGDNDIIPDVYRTQRATDVIQEWNSRFDVEIWERFEHRELARIFAPLMVDGYCVGVIEYGCARKRRDTAFTEGNRQKVEQVIAKHTRPEFALARPGVLVERVAQYAMDALNADAATIYVYEGLQGLLPSLGKPILMAGAGKADPAFVHDFVPRDKGFGHCAMQSGEIVPAGEATLQTSHPRLFARGVKTLVAIPLILDDKPADSLSRCGVLYVDYRTAPHQFSNAEKRVANAFAQKAEIAIGNLLLAERAKVRNEEQLRNRSLLDIVRALAGADLACVRSEVTRNVLQLLDADNVVLFEYLQNEDKFLHQTIYGYFIERGTMETQIAEKRISDSVSRHVLKKGTQFCENVQAMRECVKFREGQTRFVLRENIKSSAMLALGDSKEMVGVMFVNFRNQQTFTKARKMELNTLASSVGMAIHRSRSAQKGVERKQKELNALKQMELALETADLAAISSVLDLILMYGAQVLGASAGAIMVPNNDGTILQPAAIYGGFPKFHYDLSKKETGIIGKAFAERVPQLAQDVRVPPWNEIYIERVPGTVSELAVPILRGSDVRGVINLESPSPGTFVEEDCNFVQSLWPQVSLVYACLERFRESIPRERLLAIIADRVAHASDEDAKIAAVLTAVTAGQGLGFSRAMLFQRDGQHLAMRAAVGPLAREEAQRTWDTIKQQPVEIGKPVGAQAEKHLQILLEGAMDRARNAQGERTPLEAWLAEQGRIDVYRSEWFIARCARDKQHVIVEPKQSDELRDKLRDVADGTVGPTRIAVPIIKQGMVAGVLAVDSEFLPAPSHPMWRETKRMGSTEELIGTLEKLAGLLGG